MTKPTDKISVCFISLRAYPLFNPDCRSVFGGAELDLYLLATELACDSRFDVWFVVGDYGQPAVEKQQNVTLLKSLDMHGNYFRGAGKLWNALHHANAAVYIQEACSLLTTTIALYCKYHHRRFIYRTAHTNETDGTYLRRHPIRGRLALWAFRNAEQLITQNSEDQHRLQQRFGLNSTVIRNACRLKQKPDSARDILLWVGRSDHFKQPHLFIELARLFPQHPFTMICSRADNDSEYDTLAHQARTVPNLTFIPGLPFEQADAYFEKARLYISTSSSEGFPNTFVQACKSSTPILSLSVNPDLFLDHHDCGRCADGNWNQFITLFNELIQPEIALRLGRNGWEYARKYHDINHIIESYKTLLLAFK